MLVLILRSAGHEVDVASSAQAARDHMQALVYDLVMADGRLPDGNGIEIADEAQARGSKALIVTAYALQLPAEGLARHEYLMKPVRPAELLSAVERQLSDGGVPRGKP